MHWISDDTILNNGSLMLLHDMSSDFDTLVYKILLTRFYNIGIRDSELIFCAISDR